MSYCQEPKEIFLIPSQLFFLGHIFLWLLFLNSVFENPRSLH